MDNERETWLASLKEGDEVAVKYGDHYAITTIKRITPTRIIKTDNGGEFKGGYMKTGTWGTWAPHYKYIVPVTQEIKDTIKRKKLISKVASVRPTDMTLDQLERINAILEEANKHA